MIFGGDYNPEQWPEHVWRQDARLMQEAGVNLVSIGIFAWSRIQPQEGVYDFDWLDRVLDVMHGAGVGVNLATATASPPHWMTLTYPSTLPVTEDGTILQPGSRQHYAPTSPDYRRLASELVRAIAIRYVEHPAVKMWHINNEYACHVPYDYSMHAERAFRAWVAARYSTVDELNAAWGADFWSQRYTTFDEILPPRRAPYAQNPGALLDFRRFTSDAVLELYTMERDILRQSGAQQPITTNFMGPFFPLDYWKWAAEVDIIADDCYPDPRDRFSFREAAFSRDLMRSLKAGRPWILMEQAPSAVNSKVINAAKRPGQMAALSEQAIARGATGVMFFQWRQSRAGVEKFHSAMVPHAGTETRTWKEVRALGQSLRDRSETRTTRARVALVFEWENWWALEQPNHPAPLDYLKIVLQWYSALHARHVVVDIVLPHQDLSVYSLVVAPALYLLRAPGAEQLRQFVEQGGTLVTTAFTDIVDENDRLREGGYAMQLREVLGAHPTEFSGLTAGDEVTVEFDDETAPPVSAAGILADLVVDPSARVTARTSSGQPALVEHPCGSGISLHTATLLDDAGTGHVIDIAMSYADVRAEIADLPSLVEAISTSDGVVLINHDASTIELEGIGALGPFATRVVAVESRLDPDIGLFGPLASGREHPDMLGVLPSHPASEVRL